MELDCLVIGGGLAGLTAARALHRAGRRVAVLERARGLGGRASTRRIEDVPVDHGAQFFTARSDAFQAQVADWSARGVCHVWSRGFHRWQDGILRARDGGDAFPRYACREGMTALAKDLAQDVAVRRECEIVALTPAEGGWQVTPRSGEGLQARSVLLAMPAPQALPLLESLPGLEVQTAVSALREHVALGPTLALILRFARDPEPTWLGIQIRGDDVLSWIGNDSSKRPSVTPAGKRIVVVHAAAAFSRRHVDGDHEAAADLMVQRAAEIGGGWLADPPLVRQTHRWRHAVAERGFRDVAYLPVTANPPLLLCGGDAFLGAKVEGAFLSGDAAATAVLTRLEA